jgi:hypothetical protein
MGIIRSRPGLLQRGDETRGEEMFLLAFHYLIISEMDDSIGCLKKSRPRFVGVRA